MVFTRFNLLTERCNELQVKADAAQAEVNCWRVQMLNLSVIRKISYAIPVQLLELNILACPNLL